MRTWLRALLYRVGLQRRDALLRKIVESSADCIVCLDARGMIQMANPAATALFAPDTRALGGVHAALFIPAIADLCARLAADPPGSRRSLSVECDARNVDGQVFPVELSLSRVSLHEESLYSAVVRDLSARRARPCEPAHENFGSGVHPPDARPLTMLSELRQAITRGAIGLSYQPQVNLVTGGVDCVEAMLRWHHPTLGDVGPAELIAAAETSDLIWPLTEWTLQEAVRQLRQWRAHGLALRIAVNLSARVLQDRSSPDRLAALLTGSGIEHAWLELEITESAMMADPQRALSVLQRVHELGLQISVDDFGVGLSSLAHLRDLPVHALKVDKSFVIDMHERSDNRIIVDSAAQMAHALSLRVIAEGVETRWQAEHLKAVGYDCAQGRYFSGALPADQLMPWIQARGATARFVGEHRDGDDQRQAV